MISSLLSCQSPYKLLFYSNMSFLWFLLISLACHVIRTKKPNIWRIMCRRWLISDKEVGSELINKPLSPSYCYCKNFLVYFWQININFCSTHESDLRSDFWQFKELCELHLWFKHGQITGTQVFILTKWPLKIWSVYDNQVKSFSTEACSAEQGARKGSPKASL